MVITTLVGLHACMAATRVAASLAVVAARASAWMVGVLLSLYAVAPDRAVVVGWRLADRHVFIGRWSGRSVCHWSEQPCRWSRSSCGRWPISGLLTAAASASLRWRSSRAGQMARDASDLKRVFSWVALGPALSNTLAPVITGLADRPRRVSRGVRLGALLPAGRGSGPGAFRVS